MIQMLDPRVDLAAGRILGEPGVDPAAVCVGAAAGEQGAPRRHAQRARAVGTVKADAFGGNGVDVGGVALAQNIPAQLIGNDHDQMMLHGGHLI